MLQAAILRIFNKWLKIFFFTAALQPRKFSLSRLVFEWRWQPRTKCYLNFGNKSCHWFIKRLLNNKKKYTSGIRLHQRVHSWQINFHRLKQKQGFAEITTNSFHCVQQYSWRCYNNVGNFFFMRSVYKIKQEISGKKHLCYKFGIWHGFKTKIGQKLLKL